MDAQDIKYTLEKQTGQQIKEVIPMKSREHTSRSYLIITPESNDTKYKRDRNNQQHQD